MTEQMMRDVDPARVAASLAAKRRFMAEVDALPETRRCKGAPVNHDGSCFRCGDDQGEYARCAIRAALTTQGGGGMSPLPIDERRVGKLAEACDLIDDERPRGPGWKQRHADAYAALASACNLAAASATLAQKDTQNG